MEVLEKIVTFDGFVIFGFLILNLLIGIYFSKGITSIKEYAIGTRSFSTTTVAYTIVATWIGGNQLTAYAYETYKNGLYIIIPHLAGGFMFLIAAYFYIPRMQEFLGKLSIAEAMGDMYGNSVRAVSALSGTVLAIGNIAAQFAILIIILTKFMGVSGMYAVLLVSIVVISYSTLGGIKAVTFTDVIQFFTFGLVIPLTVFFIWISLDNGISAVISTLQLNPIFDFKGILDYNNPRILDILLLFLFYLFPEMEPALFQRISMSKSIKHAMKSFFIAGIIIMFYSYIILDFIGILLKSDTRSINLSESELIDYILNNYLPLGFKSIFIVGIIAMAISTADSYINVATILCAYDFKKAIGIKIPEKYELLSMRVIAFLIGIASLITCMYYKNFFDLLIAFYSFYITIVSIPFVLAIFGFRSTATAVLLGMVAGFITNFVCEFYIEIKNGVFIAILANLFVLIGSHYLLRQSGGWVGIKDDGTFLEIQKKRKDKIHYFFSAVKNFNIVHYLQNAISNKEFTYSYLGIFCMISIFFNFYSLPNTIIDNDMQLIEIIAYTSLFLSTILISYPAWLQEFKSPALISLCAHITIFAVFGFAGSLFVLINSFGQLQIIILTISLIVAIILLRWYIAVLLIGTSIVCATLFYKRYTGLDITFENITTEFTMFYLMFMVIAISIIFLKPKEDHLEILEAKSTNLWQKVNDMDKEVRNSNNIKTEFLNNISHEVRTPITGITSLGKALYDNYDNLPDSKRRECVYTIAKNSERLISLMNNILDLSSLTSLQMELYLQKVNLSDIVEVSIKRCKKLYLEDKELRFDINIEKNIYAKCDKHHITHTIDNLIINAICYSKPRTIVKIALKQEEGIIKFAIRDEGIGIPVEELPIIFRPFTTSSKTRTPAGGRGIGLALCYAVITAHKGRIWAESDGASWAEFKFEI